MTYAKRYQRRFTVSFLVLVSLIFIGDYSGANRFGFHQLTSLFEGSVQAAEKKDEGSKWTCPMHPHYIADEYGSCPICGMDLVKIQSTSEEQPVEGGSNRTIITIPTETIQKMGVRVAKVESSAFGRRVRSFGIVSENERMQTVLSARVEGWVEKLNITAVGDEVKSGDVLFEIFSPELIVSQRDFLLSLGKSKQARNNIRRRLKSFGVQDKALQLIAKKRNVQQTVPFYAERQGTVAELHVSSGSYVRRGMMIAKIKDYSQVWVIVNVSEKDMSFIAEGTKATVLFPNLPGKNIISKVDYVYPEINEKTRTGRVRLVLENKAGELRPGSYADVVFEAQISERLSVPSEAVLKDESGDHVVVSLGEGRFVSKPVKLGLVTGGRAEVRSGIQEGDDVVVSAQFLIDSESSLRESFRKLKRLQLPFSELKLSKEDFAKFDHMVDAALYIHETLKDGKKVDAAFLNPAVSIKNIMWSDYKNTKLSGVLSDAEVAFKQAQKANTATELRAALNSIIDALEPWLLEGAPQHYSQKGVKLFKTKDGLAKWLQLGAKPINPYGGGEAELMPWPQVSNPTDAMTKDGEAEKKAPVEDKTNDPRGSHGMRGSHNVN